MVMSLLHPNIEDYAGDKFVEFGVERASMNIMAAKCLYKRSEVFGKNNTSDGNLVLNRILLDNSRYLNSVQEEDGGFGTFHKTALALHAQRFTPIQCMSSSHVFTNYEFTKKEKSLFDRKLTHDHRTVPHRSCLK